MAILFNDQEGTPLLDANMSAWMRRWLNVIWGAVFGIAAAAIGCALWSYNVGDPGFLSATSMPPVNWLGEPGAFAADAMMRYAGLGSWALVLFLAVWAVRFVLSLGEERIWARLLLAMPALAFAPAFASLHAVYPGWPLQGAGLGGTFGDAGARMLLDVLPVPDALS